MNRTISLLLLVGVASAGVIVDRMAVIVGKHVIKASDIERDFHCRCRHHHDRRRPIR